MPLTSLVPLMRASLARVFQDCPEHCPLQAARGRQVELAQLRVHGGLVGDTAGVATVREGHGHVQPSRNGKYVQFLGSVVD